MNQVEYEQLAAAGEILLWEVTFEQDNPECLHPLPADWDMGPDVEGNPLDCEPRTDPRWQPMTFMYLDSKMKRIAITQVPRCNHEAVGSYKNLIEKQRGQTVYYVTGGLPGDPAAILYSDVDGAVGANDS